MNRTASSRSAFSLVELSLAIGVAAVALASVVGLLGVASDSNAAAGRDTAIATMTAQVLNDLRSAPSFEALWKEEPRAAGFIAKPNFVPPKPSDEPADTSYFFTEDGRQVASGATDAIYECTVRKIPDLPRREENKGPSNLLKLQLVFTSPVAANPTHPDRRPHRRVVNASIARF